MSNVADRVPALTGGISQQPPTVRFPGQVSDASNVDFDVSAGCSKRYGTRYVKKITGLTVGANYRLHPIERDSTEQYLLLRGTNTINVYTLAGSECSVFAVAGAKAYLSGATADDVRASSVADTTILVNRQKTTNYQIAPAFTVTSEHDDFDILSAQNPAAGSYLRASGPTVAEPAGYWQYNPGSGTFAQMQFAVPANAGWYTFTGSNLYNISTVSPQGCRIFFSKVKGAQTSVSWTASTRTLTKTGAFADLPDTGTWWVNITGGTGATANYYRIESKTSANAVVLATGTGLSGSNQTDYTFDGLGVVGTINVDTYSNPPADIYDVAKAYTASLRANGAPDASVYATKTIAGMYMTVVSPFAGSQSGFPATGATRAPISATVYDLTQASFPFNTTSSTITDGTGINGTKPVLERWTRVPAPEQAKAVIDPESMPVRLVRQCPAGTWPTSVQWTTRWEAMTAAMQPYGWWRLGESSGTTAGDSIGTNNGTYNNSPTLAVAGAIAGSSNTAVTFNGTNQDVTVGPLTDIDKVLARPFTIEMWIKTTSVSVGQNLIGIRDIVSLTQQCYLVLNASTKVLEFRLIDLDSNGVNKDTVAINTINDGNWHHLAVAVDGPNNAVDFYFDGAAVAIANTYGASSPDRFQPFKNALPMTIASYASNYAAATIDEVVIHNGAFTATMASQRYNQGINASYSHPATFILSTCPWGTRPSGSENSNPLPEAIERQLKLSDAVIFDNRLSLAGGERLFTSIRGDYYQLFAFDAETPTETDPIDIPTSTRQVTIINSLVPFRNTMLVYTDASQQFEVAGNGAFTPSQASITPTTNYAFLTNVVPAVMGSQAYYVAANGNAVSMMEQEYNDGAAQIVANNVTSHVPTLLPSGIKTITTSPASNRVFVIPTTGQTIYVYRNHYVGTEKKQSAWTKYTFDGGYRLVDAATINNELYMLVESASQYVLESIPLGRVTAPSGFPHTVHLDRAMNLTGVHSAGTTTWTLPDSLTDTTINRAIKTDGTVLPLASGGGGTTVTSSGDHSASAVWLGRLFTPSVQLTQPFRRDQNGNPILWAFLVHNRQVFDLKDTRSVTFTASRANAANQTVSYTSPTTTPVVSEQFITNFNGEVFDTTLSITDTGVGPFTVASILYDVQEESRQ
jgi:hypothetical protein